MLNILIIDDSATIRKMLEKILLDMNLNVIATANSAVEGIELFNKYKPDFVTMDVNMPGMNGITALKRIREIHKDANIVMLTSKGDNALVVEAIKYGAKGYILKPLDSVKIKEAIEAVFPNEFKEKKIHAKYLDVQNYESNIKDSLTDLYTVQYMHDTMEHLMEIHNRDENIPIGFLIININNLDELCQTFGVMQKDVIVIQIADEILNTISNADFPIKLTDNEFGVFVVGSQTNRIKAIASRLKLSIEAIQNKTAIVDSKLVVSIGMSVHNQNEKLIHFLERTDTAVKQATQREKSKIYFTK